MHKFIGAAIGTRNEVLSVLHLLDKPDEAWDESSLDDNASESGYGRVLKTGSPDEIENDAQVQAIYMGGKH